MQKRADIIKRFESLGIENLVYYPNDLIKIKLNNYKTLKCYMVYFGDEQLTYFTGTKFKSVGYTRIEEINLERK